MCTWGFILLLCLLSNMLEHFYDNKLESKLSNT